MKQEQLNIFIENRVLEVANYIIETKATTRKAAKVFGISKSTVHKYITNILPNVNYSIFKKANEVLMYNKSQRSIRGGETTRLKYLKS